MNTRDVDVAIIGAGSAGMTAYRAALQHTDNVLLIEEGQYGTTCARVGCMPSKLLIAAAEVSHQIDQAGLFGINVDAKQVDGQRVMARLKSERDRFTSIVEKTVLNWPEKHRLIGKAVFVARNELRVDDHTRVFAKRIVIATGSTPTVPKPWYALGDRLLISDDIFYWDDLPASVAVVGTGVIGMEMAQALSRLGVKTHLLGIGNQLGPISDPQVNNVMRDVLKDQLKISSNAFNVQPCETGVHISYKDGDQIVTTEYEYLVAATGRRPNIESLNLSATGIALDSQGLPSFDLATGQIADSTLFIAGDVNNAHPLLHEAADDGRIAGDNAGRYPDVRRRPRRAPLSIIFTDPQIMLTGQTFKELEASRIRFAIGQASFEDQGRSRIMAKNQGLIRVYGEHGSGRFLGAEMAGPAAEHIGHLLSWAVQHQLTVQQMIDSPFYHPVIEEGVRSALRQLNRELESGTVFTEACLECMPGT